MIGFSIFLLGLLLSRKTILASYLKVSKGV